MRHTIYARTKADVEISASDENYCAYQKIRRPSYAPIRKLYDMVIHLEVRGLGENYVGSHLFILLYQGEAFHSWSVVCPDFLLANGDNIARDTFADGEPES